MNKMLPITQRDFGPQSATPTNNLSKGAKASSPNKTASTSRCTSFAFFAISITPMLNKTGKTRPIAVSSLTKPVFWINSTMTTVITPVKAAKRISNGEFKSCVTKNPITIPGSIEWLMASLIKAIFRSTKNTPGMAQAIATMAAISCISICGLLMWFFDYTFPQLVYNLLGSLPIVAPQWLSTPPFLIF